MNLSQAEIEAQIDTLINANGVRAITGIVANAVLKLLLRFTYSKRARVVEPAKVLTIEAGSEISFVEDFWNKGTVNINTAVDNTFGAGAAVPQYGILSVDGWLHNEGVINNNGLII